MIKDKARKWTDKKLDAMEKRIESIYKRSNAEIRKSWDKYLDGAKERSKKLLADIETAVDDKAKKAAQAEYDKFMRNYTFNNERYKKMVDKTANELLHVHETAVAYVNGEMPPIYATNYNGICKNTASQIKGYSFSTVSPEVVKNLASENKTLLPYKEVNGKKTVRWNTKKINAEVLQGILQGESMDKIAKRLNKVTEMSKDASIRNARTSVTSAENKGRFDGIKKMQDDGVVLQKKWLSSGQPGRTRDWHLPGGFESVVVDVDEPFVNDFGEIMYPGDPTADPANVYNCRCSLGTVVKGFKKAKL